MSNLALRPSYWASVSGGKDSLYMLKYILGHRDLYPLDGVVHFELEIDYPFIHNVIDYMEDECRKYGIKFVRIKPDKTWEQLYYEDMPRKDGKVIQHMFPTATVRWCNNEYKLSAYRKLQKYLKSVGYYLVCYIGYCVDEKLRAVKHSKKHRKNVYPLVDAGINEDCILEWAKTQPIFNDYYKYNRRCGCMYCPMALYMNLAYLLKYYPDNYEYMMTKVRETEAYMSEKLERPFIVLRTDKGKYKYRYNADYVDNIVKTKWLPRLCIKEAEIEHHQKKLF